MVLNIARYESESELAKTDIDCFGKYQRVVYGNSTWNLFPKQTSS